MREHTKPDDFILVHGDDWSPTIGFYSERKSLTQRFANGNVFLRVLQNIDKYSGGLRLGAIVVCEANQHLPVDQETGRLLRGLTEKYRKARLANCIVLYLPSD